MAPAPSASSDHFKRGERCLLLVGSQRYLVTLLRVDEDTVQVTYPSAHFPVEGMYVQLEFHDDEGFTTYESEVVHTPTEPGDGLVLKHAHENWRASHRRSWRVDTDFHATLKDHVHPRRVEARVVNISVGGMQVESDMDFGMGHNMDIQLTLPGLGSHRVLGAVVHLMGTQGQTHQSVHRAGIKFINPEPETTRALADFVRQRVPKSGSATAQRGVQA